MTRRRVGWESRSAEMMERSACESRRSSSYSRIEGFKYEVGGRARLPVAFLAWSDQTSRQGVSV